MGGSCHRPKLSTCCQSPANIRDWWRHTRIHLISRERSFDSKSPVGELHIQCSISLVTDHIVEGLPRAFRVRQGEVAPRINFNVFTTLIPQPIGNACCRDGFRAPGYNCQCVVLEVVVPGFSGMILLVNQGAVGILPHQFHHGLFIHH